MGIRDKILAKSKKRAVSKLKKETTNNQIKFLSDSLDSGLLSASSLKKVLEEFAPEEIRKGIETIAKEGGTPTVDALLGGVRKEAGFMQLADRLGLDENYFIKLAEAECAKWRDK